MEIIQSEDLTFCYTNSSKNILNNVSFSVNEGDFVLLCGPSGCGKTTLLKHLKHLIAPVGIHSGKILYKGEDIIQVSQKKLVSEIGYVFQNPESQIVCDKPFAEMAFGLENLGLSSNEIRRRVAEMASFFGIEHYFNTDIHTLSGGQKQLLNLASIMVMQPSVLLLDEPTSMLDPVSTNEFFSIINKINKELGLTIIICEHQLETIFSVVDKVIYMENGRIAGYGPPGQIALKMFEESKPMAFALPTSARIFKELNNQESDFPENIPLNVRDGRNYLIRHVNIKKINGLAQSYTNHPKDKNVSLSAKNVYFRYEKALPDVLKNISLTAYYGELLSILGGNGVGKSTLLSLLCGANTPYRGKIKFSHKEKAVYLPQNPQMMFIKDTVIEDLEFLLKINGIHKEHLEKVIEEYDFFKEIPHLYTMNPLDLSGGEQQRAALLKLMLLSPKILLLDEPTKGLDAFAKFNLAKILNKFKEEGITIILVTHDLEFAAEYSNRCVLLFNGEIVSEDTPVEFFSNNHFYTTETAKITKNIINKAITVKDVINNAKLHIN